MMMRGIAKAAFEHTVILSGVAHMRRRQMRARTLILAYHNVVPDHVALAGDVPNHLRFSAFRSQLQLLRETHDVVPLAEVLTADAGRSGKPRVAITFDDAYRGAVLHAIPEVARQGLSATIFVAPGLLGKPFWWDAFAAADGRGLDATFRDRALNELRGDDQAIRSCAVAMDRLPVALQDVYLAASEPEVLRAAELPGISIGSHTWSHRNLTRLDPSELHDELVLPFRWLHERIPTALPWIAYPYGSHDARVNRAAARAGYEGALGICGGWLPQIVADPFTLPRVNIPHGLTIQGFALRAAGLMAG